MKRTVAGLLTLALGLAAGTAQAQSSARRANGAGTPITFGGSLGLSMPMGDAGSGLDTGFNLEGLIGIHPRTMPIEFRGELMYHRFGVTGADGHQSILGIVPNVVYPFKTQSRIRPYLIGGIGLYHVSVTATGNFGGSTFTATGSETDVGLNVGGGLRFPLSNSRASLFAEARFHDVFTSGSSMNMIPITVGITF